jgi:hypothetical protein
MSRKLASVQRIVDIRPIQDADFIEVAKVLGWECVVKKSDGFKVGDLVVYVEVDSIVPDRPEFDFLRERKFKVKTIKLRGQVSQGLVLPLSILPKGNYKEGDDVTNILGIIKYDPQAELEQKLMEEKKQINKKRIYKFLSRTPFIRRILPKRKTYKFPEFIKKTDEDRIQLFPNICEEYKDLTFSVTEKLDGQSATYFLLKNTKKIFGLFPKTNYIFGVCSRNLYLPKENNSSYWKIAKKYNIRNVLEKLIGNNDYIVLQGEIIGPGIQGNKYQLSDYDFYVFNYIYPHAQFNTIEAKNVLEPYGIKVVPILEDMKLKPTIQDMVEYSKGKSKLLPIEREGIVIRNYEKNLSFKVVNPDFLLTNDE